MVDKLPGARVLNGVLWLIVMVGIGLGIGVNWPRKPVFDEKSAMSILKVEQMEFLVTRSARTQIVIEHNESNWLGEWRGVLWATVTWRWGVDLRKIGPNDIHRDGDTIVIRLPEPELLDFALVPGSVRFMSKSTSVPKLHDYLNGGSQRELLESHLHDQALDFAHQQHLLPTRQEILQQLCGASVMLERAAGAKLRFE